MFHIAAGAKRISGRRAPQNASPSYYSIIRVILNAY